MNLISREEIAEIANRGTPPTEFEKALIQAQGVIDGVREGQESRIGAIIDDEAIEENQ